MRGAARRSGVVQIAVSMIAMSLFVDVGGCSSGVSYVGCNAMGGASLSVAPVDPIDWSVHFLMDVSRCELLQRVNVDGFFYYSFRTGAATGGESKCKERNDRKVE